MCKRVWVQHVQSSSSTMSPFAVRLWPVPSFVWITIKFVISCIYNAGSTVGWFHLYCSRAAQAGLDHQLPVPLCHLWVHDWRLCHHCPLSGVQTLPACCFYLTAFAFLLSLPSCCPCYLPAVSVLFLLPSACSCLLLALALLRLPCCPYLVALALFLLSLPTACVFKPSHACHPVTHRQCLPTFLSCPDQPACLISAACTDRRLVVPQQSLKHDGIL